MLDPWALDPHHPLIFTQKLLKSVPSRLYHIQITVKSVYISIFGLKYAAITSENAFKNLKWAKNQHGSHDTFFLVLHNHIP